MASNGDEVRNAAIREMARRELARRQAQPQTQQAAPMTAAALEQFVGPRFENAHPVRSALGSVGRGIVGAGDAALGMAAGMLTTPVNEIARGMENALFERDVGDEALPTYQPKTPEGQAITRGIGTVLSPVNKAIDWGAQTDNPDPAIRATGHLIKAAIGLLPLKAPIGKRLTRPKVPTIPELRASSQAAYAAAEKGSGVVSQNSLANVANNVQQILANEGVDATLHPATMAGLNRLMDEATRPGIAGHSLKGLEIQRRVLSAAESAAKAGSDDARLAGKMVDEFDDFVDNLTPKDLVGGVGTADVAAKNYATARAEWAKMRKAETIEGLMERAKNASPTYTQAGYENALRIEFKNLANNPRRFRYFTNDEKAAILRVVRGTVPQNTLRLGGKLAVRGPISGGITIGGGMALGGPAGAAALAGVGEASKLAATLMRIRDANRVSEMVRLGQGPSARRTQITPRQQLGYLPTYSLAVPGNALYPQDDQPRNALR